MSETPDGYEARFMDAGRALVRSRKPMPWFWFALLGALALVQVVSAIVTGLLAPLLISVPLLAAITLLFAVLRVVVTREHLHVQLGLWGPKVAIADITRIEAMDYPVRKYGGWGIRLGLDGSWAYSVPGGTGRGVRVEYRAGDRTKAFFVSTDDADEVARTVRQLQGGAGGATGVRVDAEAPAASADALDVEAEGDARGEAARRGR